MANTKSAKKRIRQNEKRRLRNRFFKGNARSFIKRARLAIQEGNLEEAEMWVRKAYKALDKAASKGVIHPNNAARRKSRLMNMLNRARQAS
nr:30S ribosomal protein S20 [Ardenticatena sp.]